MFSPEVEALREEFVSLFASEEEATNTETTICSAVTPNFVSDAVERVIWSSSIEDSDLAEYFGWLIGQATEMANN